MSIPFLFIEENFDIQRFQDLYGPASVLQNINSPTIFAIPEDEVEPSSDQNSTADPSQEQLTNGNPIAETPPVNQQAVQSEPEIQTPQLSPEDQKIIDQETEPLKKIHLINSLYKLSYFLKNKFQNDADLELLLKYGAFLSYNSLRLLAYQIIASIQQQVIQAQKEEAMRQQNPTNDIVAQTDGANNNAQETEI